MVRRILSMLLSICLLVTSLPLQAIAETMPEHEHIYSSEVTTEATCKQDGVSTYTCDCGDRFTMPISAKGHSYENGECVLCGAADPETAIAVTEPAATVETVPVETTVPPTEAETELVETEPEMQPEQTAPVETEPEGTEPKETEPEETVPVTVPTEPVEETEPETEPQEMEEVVEEYADSAVAGDYTYSVITLEDGTEAAVITKYSGTETDVVIPGTIDGYPVVRIGNQAFRNNTKIQSVVIPEGVTELEDGGYDYDGYDYYEYYSSFYGCASLKSVTLPESLTKIGDYTFDGCKVLAEIKIPDNVVSIGSKAFCVCAALKDVTLSKSLKTIGSYAFQYCSSLTALELPEGLETIGNDAFNGTKIAKLELPDTVTSVDVSGLRSYLKELRWTGGIPVFPKDQFRDFTALETVVIPEGVTELEDGGYDRNIGRYLGAFCGCTNLKNIALPKKLTIIGDYAFYNCTSLKSIILPDGLASIGDYAFYYCSELNHIEFPVGLTSIGNTSFIGCTGLERIQLPDGLTSIGGNAFQGCWRLSSVELPGSLTFIGAAAFRGCTSLLSIELPDSLTSISDYAFDNCRAMKNVIFPDSLTSIGHRAFIGCADLSSIELPESLTSIGEYAFGSCSGLSSIELPERLTIVSDNVFANCTNLRNIELPAGVQAIGKSAFSGCTSLSSIELPENLASIEDGAFSGCSSLSGIELPERLTTIDDYTFDNCTNLSSVKLPRGLTSIGSAAFRGCTSLSNIELPKSLSFIGDSVFSGCINLTAIDFPENLTTLGSYAFQNCTGLSSITLPENLTHINEGTFEKCSGLTTIILSEGITSIGQRAFQDCTSLISIPLPDGLISIGGYAFENCTNLRNVILPRNLQSLEGGAFRGCIRLSGIELPEQLTTIGDYTFYNCTNLSGVKLPRGLTSIGSAAFRGCATLSSIELPESLVSIGSSAFDECTSLTAITLPEGLKTIGSYAFADCSDLSSITLSENLTNIGNGAFKNCASMTTITLPENLTAIGQYAFQDCTGLSVVKAGQEITSVGYQAFYNCPGLTIFVWPGTVMEDYAIDNGLNYAYYNEFGNDGTLQVTLNPKLYEGMQLVLQFADYSMTRTITDDSVYEFAGLGVGSDCTIQIINSFGDVILQTGVITIVKETRKTLEDSKDIGNLQVAVADEQGNDKITQVEIKWYDEAGRPVGTGAKLRGVRVGKVLTCRVQLNAADGRVYGVPADIVHTVTSGDNLIDITLEKIPEITLMGRITNGSQSITGASVTAVQKINGLYDKSITAVTDKDGMFALKVPAADAKITVHASGYAVKELEVTELTADRDLGDMELEPVSGAEVTLDLQLIRTGGEPEALTALDDLDIQVRNATRNVELVNIWRQNMTLVLAEEASAGEELEIIVSSLKNQFAPVSVSVILDAQRKATTSLSLTEYGKLEVTFESTKNETIQLLVYGENGSMSASLSQEAKDKKLTTGLLPDGIYSVVLMGGGDFFVYPDTLEGLALAGLTEGTDYVLQTVEVTSGLTTQATFKNVPVLNESQFYYTDPSRTTVSSSKTSISAGRFFTLRAATAFAAKYQGQMSDIQWVIQLPEGLEYYPGTLTVDKVTAAYEQIDNRIFVPVEDPSLDLRLCLLATGSGKVKPAVYLQFVYDGKTVRQPVGAVEVQIDPFDFEVTGKTFDPSVTVIGTGVAGTEVQLYDNGVLVGQTKTNASGSWKLTFDLYKPGTYSEHKLYAQMNVVTGAKIRSTTHTVIYQYSPEPVEVKTVAMYYNGRLTSVINFQTGEVKGSSYSVAGSATITFTVDFDCPEISRLSDVRLEVTQDDGQIRVLKAVLDRETGLFVTSDTFTMNAMPVNVAVSYVYDGELVFSEAHLAELKAKNESIMELADHWNEIDTAIFEKLMQPIDLDFDCEVEIPDELIAAVNEYNALTLETTRDYKELQEAIERIYGEVELGDNYISLNTEHVKTKYEEKTLSNFSVDEKISEGYELFSLDANNGKYILIKTIDDFENGYAEVSVIDTTNDSSGISHLMYNGVRGLQRLQKATPANANKNGQQYTTSVEMQMSNMSARGSDIADAMNTITEISSTARTALATAKYLHDKIQFGMEKYFELISDNVANLQKELDTLNPNSSSAEAIRTRIDKLTETGFDVDEIRITMKETTGVALDALGNVAAVAGTIVDTMTLQNESVKAGQLLGVAMETGNIDIWAAAVQQTLKTETKAVATLGNLVFSGLFGKAGKGLLKVKVPNKIENGYLEFVVEAFDEKLFGKFLDKLPGVNLLLNLCGTIVDGIFEFAGVNDSIDKVYNGLYKNSTTEKYSDNTTSLANPLTVIRDPSGYIYEAVPSNRLPGVTVTCYEKVTKYDIYDEPYEEVQFWDAAQYDQRNPLTTDAWGQYAWDVPVGWWQVKAELDGYETAYSEWLPVPPPQLDVNLGLVSYAAPEISDIFAQTDSVEVSFSKYLRTETLTTDNVTISANGAAVSGTLELLNAEAEPGETGKTLASKIRFVPDAALTTGATVTVAISSNLLSYADVPAANGESAEATVITIPDSLFVAENISLTYQGTGVVSIQAKPAYLAAGQTVQVSTASDLMLKVEEQTVTLDENGMALIHITGKLPGETELVFTMNDGRLEARSTVRILMPETSETLTDVESLIIVQDYLALDCGKTASLLSEIQPKKLADKVIWSVEEGGEKTIAVDSTGNVTALTPGTAYVLATVSDSEKTLTARCRVDVAESLVLEGVKLGSNNLTTEVYSTEYAKLDMLLLLPQNYSASAEGESQPAEKLSAAISKAYFTDEALRNLFDLKLLDDRTVKITPTAAAISGGKLAKAYTGTITVMVEGKTYETDPLTLNIKTSLPKLKVTVPAFNAFYSGSSQEIQVTGATVTDISAEALPEWLTLNGTELTLTDAAPKKNASAKVNLEIMTEEWAVPVSAAATIKCSYKAPGLKLSASSIQLSDQPGSASGIRLQLVPSNKKEILSDLKVLGITAPMGYSIENYENGTFTLKTESGFVPGKINLEVAFSNTAETLKLPVTVKTVQTKLKLDKTSINLNGEIGDSAVIGITATPADYILTAPSFRLVDKAGSDKLDSGELDVRFENGTVRVSTTDKTEIGANYTLCVKAGGSKEATAKIKIVGGVPSVSLKQTKDLDLSFAEPAIITASFKNYAGGKIESFAYSVAETKSGADATNQFKVEEKNGQFYLTCNDSGAVNEKGAYVLNLKLTLADGKEYEASLKLKVKRTAIELKLSSSKLTLNKAVSDAASIAVTCTTKGYEFTKPVWQLMDKSGKQPMEGKLDIRWVDGKLRIGTNTQTEYGASYKLLISAAEGAAATALTISIPAENKSNITATIKAKGNLDVIRSTAVIVTPSYKNCLADTARTEELMVVRSDNQVVTDQFDIVKNTDGTYSVAIAKGAQIDMSKKYQLQLVAKFGIVEVSAKPIALNIKMGSAKLTAETEGTLFSKDKHSRMNLRFTSADGALNGVARVEIKDAKQAEIFEIFDYGNGEFSIGFKNGKILASAKPITLTLDVFIEGNTSAKPNATLKLKLSIAP